MLFISTIMEINPANKSNISTPPIGIDDIKSYILFEDIAVHFFTLSTLQFPLEVCGQEDQCL